MVWRSLVVCSVPLFCSIVQMSSPPSSLRTISTYMFPFGCCLNLFLSNAFPSLLVHVNLGGGFPSALQLRMPDIPETRVCWGLLFVKRAVDRKTIWLIKIKRRHTCRHTCRHAWGEQGWHSWRELSPPTTASRARYPDPASYVS